jgi:hypothetical protein
VKRETINATPSWAAVLPMLLAAYSDGSVEGIDIAQQELERMAKAADRWVDYSQALDSVQAEKKQAESVANAQPQPVRRLSKSRTIIDFLDFVNSQPIGAVLEIATSQYAGNHGAVFDYRSTAPAVRSMIKQGFLEGESCFRFYRVTVVAHCYWEDEEL